jgi:transitional endoplasmic reticulum ATPase
VDGGATVSSPSGGEAIVDALRAALQVSPDNVPLIRHLAQVLMSHSRFSEAAEQYRHALSMAPDEIELKLGLAAAFQGDGKLSHALVIVEDLVKKGTAAAAAFVLYARLLLEQRDLLTAASMYRRGVDLDPSVADLELAARFSSLPTPTVGATDEDDDDDADDGRLRAAWDAPGEDVEIRIERPATRFDDVGGMEQVKDEIRLKIIHPLTHADLYKAYGKSAGGGILMYGPPGCGKTLLARATAGEIQARFMAIGINDVLDLYIGNSEKQLHALFEQARENTPCVLFFDEVDALGASRADLRQSGGRQLVNQFLAELDGVQANNEGVLVLAATNAPWQLDSAFRRPGRFDRILFVPPPDELARVEILKLHLAGKPVDKIDTAQLGRVTKEFSGADLRAVVDRAIEAKLRDAMKTGKPTPLATKDLLAAAKEVKPSTKDWFSTARNHALYANQSGLYDDILKYLKLT